ncbi:hypothetical protein D9Q98_003202 [Chlorella vulgaris]|uniref:Uncharacterized protein n=1 Tax=Chlorella vulgaris TaxID=3077 RepID=A0A9D4TS63_CHLVU|nr:hypothetical protein D9Q98_003202 [Chlorella vulgaris]
MRPIAKFVPQGPCALSSPAALSLAIKSIAQSKFTLTKAVTILRICKIRCKPATLRFAEIALISHYQQATSLAQHPTRAAGPTSLPCAPA